MATRRYCALDRNRLGPLLALDADNYQVTTTAACDGARAVFGDLRALSGVFGYEVYVWSDSRGDLTDLFSFGVATPDSGLNVVVGGGPTSYGLDPTSGVLSNGGAPIDNADPQPERVCLGVVLSLSPSLCTCEWKVNGNTVATAILPNGLAWLPAFSLGSNEAGDVKFRVNTGQDRFDTIDVPNGWSVQTSGLSNFNLSLIAEAFMASATAGGIAVNTPFAPVILNGPTISARREPQAWFHRSGGRYNPAAISALRVDNSQGMFDALLRADAIDSEIKLRRLDAPAGGVGSPGAAVVELTGVLDATSGPKLSECEIRIRDRIATYDRLLPVRRIPPYYDETVARRSMPVGMGSRRTIEPIPLDEEALLFLLGDAPQSNVPLAVDGGAPLDPDATPPQYEPALQGLGLKLDTAPVKRFAVDCSSVGDQAATPGVADILNGDGSFDVWSGGEPNGWSKPTNPPFPASVLANGSIAQVAGIGGGSALRIISAIPWTPVGVGYYFGYPVMYGPVLQPGLTYRFTFKLKQTVGGTGDPAVKWGFAILSSFRDSAQYWITPYREPLTVPLATTVPYTFTYKVPESETSALPIILTLIARFGGSTPATPSALCEIDYLVVEQVGQFEQQPLEGIGLKAAFNEILVNRLGENPSVFNAADAQAIDDATGYKIGLHYDEAPNVLDMLTDVADQWGAVFFTDSTGQIRLRRLTDPDEGDDPIVVAFDESCIDVLSIQIENDLAPGLTTNFGGRPNCAPFASAGDFVTDDVTVPPSLRAQLLEPCQYFVNSSVSLARQYDKARTRPRRILRMDDYDHTAAESNRVPGLFTKLRSVIKFTAYARGGVLGVGTTIAPRNLFYADKMTFNLPSRGLFSKRMRGLSVEPFLGDKDRKVIVRGWY